MDAVDKAQLILEGRCVKCKERLPEHSKDCSLHPWRPVLRVLTKLRNKLAADSEENKSV
jgi:hypothetical protein